jgi:hypothetical protein
MDIQIRALDTFMHGYYRGRLDAVSGETYDLPQAEADELVKAGLAEILPAGAAPAADENLDDLVGGDKMEEAPQNKMADAPTNKKAR